MAQMNLSMKQKPNCGHRDEIGGCQGEGSGKGWIIYEIIYFIYKMNELLCCTPAINTTLYIKCTPIK